MKFDNLFIFILFLVAIPSLVIGVYLIDNKQKTEEIQRIQNWNCEQIGYLDEHAEWNDNFTQGNVDGIKEQYNKMDCNKQLFGVENPTDELIEYHFMKYDCNSLSSYIDKQNLDYEIALKVFKEKCLK